MIRYRHTATGSTLYAAVERASDGYYLDAVAEGFEDYDDSDWTDYDIPLEEVAGQTYVFTPASALPTIAAGTYNVYIYEQAGGSAALTDTLLASATVHWNGSAEITCLADGLSIDTILTAVIAAIAGKSTETSGVASYKKRDGTTEIVSVTHDASGNRTASTITP